MASPPLAGAMPATIRYTRPSISVAMKSMPSTVPTFPGDKQGQPAQAVKHSDDAR
jgi:hypothetical protein